MKKPLSAVAAIIVLLTILPACNGDKNYGIAVPNPSAILTTETLTKNVLKGKYKKDDPLFVKGLIKNIFRTVPYELTPKIVFLGPTHGYEIKIEMPGVNKDEDAELTNLQQKGEEVTLRCIYRGHGAVNYDGTRINTILLMCAFMIDD